MLTSTGNTSVNQPRKQRIKRQPHKSNKNVKPAPCFLSPNKKSGTFRIKRNRERVKFGGVICSSSIDVPEIPLSYSLTGVIKNRNAESVYHSRYRKHQIIFKSSFKSNVSGVFHLTSTPLINIGPASRHGKVISLTLNSAASSVFYASLCTYEIIN